MTAPPRVLASLSAVLVLLAGACGSDGEATKVPRPVDVGMEIHSGPPPRLIASNVTTEAHWPMAMRDAQHSGQSSVAGPTTGNLRWIRRLEGNVTPGPVVGADGTIYLSSNAGILHAIAPVTGEDRWTLDSGSPSGGDLSSSPAVLDSGVIVWPAGGDLVGVSPAGAELWRFEFGSNLISPVPRKDRVYVQDMGGTLHAIALTDGASEASEAWNLDLGGTSYAGVAVGEDGAILTNVGNDVISLTDTGAAGAVAWRADLGTLSEISPAIAPDGTVVSGGNDQWIQTFAPDGTPLYRYDRENLSYSSPIVTDGGIVLEGNHKAAVIAIDLAANQHRLRVESAGRAANRGPGVWTSPVLDRNANIYFGTRAGHIVGFAWSGGELFDIAADESATIDSYPAITPDGALIVGDTTGVVRAIADDGTLPPDTAPPPS